MIARLMRAAAALLTIACLADPAVAQNGNYIVPTAPFGTSNNQAASTAFVQAAIAGSGIIGPFTCATHQWLHSVGMGGTPVCTQPAFSDISGTVGASQLPPPGASTLGGVNSKDCSSGSQLIQKINTDGTVTCATAAVLGPGSSTSGHLPTFNNTVGSLLQDQATISTNQLLQLSTLPQILSPTSVQTAVRWLLSGATVLYTNNTGSPAACGTHGTSVPTTCGVGNDSTINGFNSATPFATIQAAAQYIAANIDSRGFSPTINVAHGINRQQFMCLFQPLIGQVTFLIVGDYENPTSSTWQAPNGQYAGFIKDGCTPSISSLSVSDQGSSLGGFYSGQGGITDFRSVTFGNWNTSAAVLEAIDHGHINMLGADPLTTGTPLNTLSGTSYGQIFQAQFGGLINFNNQQVAIPNAITIGGGQSFAVVFGFGMIELASSSTFTGAGVAGTTGSRCAFTNGYSGGVNPNTIFPGSVSCTPTNGTF